MIQKIDKNKYILTSELLSDGYYEILMKNLLRMIGACDHDVLSKYDIDIICAFVAELIPKDRQIDFSKEP